MGRVLKSMRIIVDIQDCFLPTFNKHMQVSCPEW